MRPRAHNTRRNWSKLKLWASYYDNYYLFFSFFSCYYNVSQQEWCIYQ